MVEWRNKDEIKRDDEIESVIITTTDNLDGYRVTKTISIVSSEYVAGINFIKDMLAGITDRVGGRSKVLQSTLKTAREECIKDLKTEAQAQGANAVIGVDLDYSEISGGEKTMLFLVANGTAVRVEKIDPESVA